MSSSPNLQVFPAPTDDEAVAIVAAIELAWPRPVVLASGAPAKSPTPSWRWSGRWWADGLHGRVRR